MQGEPHSDVYLKNNIMRKSNFLSITLLLFLPLAHFSQGPVDGFFKGKGKLDLALSGGWQSAQNYIGGQGAFAYKRAFGFASVFGEYGITDKWDVIASVPFIKDKLQDGSFYTKYKILSLQNDAFSLAPAIGFSLPLAKYDTESALATGQRATQFHGKLVAQYKIGSCFFVQAQSGYNYALDPVPAAFLVSTKVGFSKSGWYLDAWYAYQDGEGNKTYQGSVPYSTFRELTVDFQQVGGVVYRQINPKIGAFVNASKIIDGLGTFDTFAVATGIVVKFSKKE